MKLTPNTYAQTWYSILRETPEAEWPEASKRMIKHVYKHGHVKWLPEIVRLVAALDHKHNGTTPVLVRSAHALDTATIERLVSTVLPSVKAVVETEIDERLIGGVQVETTDTRYDASASGQLQALAHTLDHKSN